MFGFPKCNQSAKTFWVFLDVDGVLNCEDDWRKPFTLNKKNVRNFQAALESLKAICKPYIILSSSWRRSWSPYSTNQPEHIRELCKAVPVTDVTPASSSGHRGREIERYLSVHGRPDGYVAIDDDPSDLEHVQKILVSSRTGFTERDGRKLLSFAQKFV